MASFLQREGDKNLGESILLSTLHPPPNDIQITRRSSDPRVSEACVQGMGGYFSPQPSPGSWAAVTSQTEGLKTRRGGRSPTWALWGQSQGLQGCELPRVIPASAKSAAQVCPDLWPLPCNLCLHICVPGPWPLRGPNPPLPPL